MKLQRALPPGGPLLLVISLGLASIFAAAAVGKLVKLPDFLKVVDALGLFPGPWQPLLTFVLIGLELTVAICLVVPSLRLIGAVLATGLLTFFVGLVSYAVNDGLNISCGCFTFLRDRSFSVGLLVQDLVLLAVTVFLAVRLTRRDDAPPKPARIDSSETTAWKRQLGNDSLETTAWSHMMPMIFRKQGLWVLVILVNLAVLGFIGHRVIRAMESAGGGEAGASLAWSDRVPSLGTVSDVDGAPVRLDSAGEHLVFFFFDAAAAGPVASVFGALDTALPETAPVRGVGVFSGDAESYRQLAYDFPVPVVPDADGALRRELGLSPDPATHQSLVVEPGGRVGLVFDGVLPAHLVIDYLWREALGRSDRPPRVEPVDVDAHSVADLVADAAPDAAQAAADFSARALPSGLDLTTRSPVEQVSDLSVFRLRRAPDGRLFGLSRTESRIVEFEPDEPGPEGPGQSLEARRTFGGFGQAPGRLMMPSDLAFDGDGRLVVLDAGNGRIQVLTEEGEALHVVPLAADVVSLAALPSGEVMLAMPGSGSAFARLDLEGGAARNRAPEAVGAFAEVDWLAGRVADHFGVDEREAAYAGLHAALNRAFVRRHPDGGLIAVPIWQPTVRRLDASGRVLSEKRFTFSGLEEKNQLFEETLQDAFEKRHLGILYLFQDLNLGADGESLGLTVVGDCPGVLLLDGDVRVTHELCLESAGSPVAPVTLAPAGPRTWWVGNAQGIYRLELG